MRCFIKKHGIQNLAMFIVVVCIAAGLVIGIASWVLHRIPAVVLPQGSVQAFASAVPQMEPTYASVYMECPTYPYQIRVPEKTKIKDVMLMGVFDDITYLIAETGLDLDRAMEDILPRAINQPVLGYQPKYEKELHIDGYLCDKKATYQVGWVETKINVRRVTEYTCAYMLYLDDGLQLAFYASVDDKDLLCKAEDLIRQMALSTRRYKIVTEGVESNVVPEPEKDKGNLFTMEVHNDFFLNDGICVFHWTNVSTEPMEVLLLHDGKVVSALDQSYSVPGEYVFPIGKCEPAAYQIEGYVEEPLYNVWVSFQELKDYVGYKESEEDPEFWIPKDPD